MAAPTSGNPLRSPGYVEPSRERRILKWSLLVCGALLAIWGGLVAAGVYTFASPGPVAAVHSTVEAQCDTCHRPTQVAADLRCERCHDPLDSQRYATDGHVALAGTTWHDAQPGACTSCHLEHRGRTAVLAQPGDGQCTSCHTFGSLARHPEFAAIKAKLDPSSSFEFSHAGHLEELAKTGAARCDACHQPNADATGFAAIAFDTQCARCHVKDNALTLNGTDLLTSGWVPKALLPAQSAGTPPPMGAPDERGRVILERMGHRDPWLRAAAAAIAQAVPAAARAGERRRVRDGIIRVSAIAHGVSMSELEDADLDSWRATLSTEIAAIEQQLAGGASSSAADDLNAIAAGLDPNLPRLPGGSVAQPALANAPADPAQFDARRAEVEQMLVAIEERGDDRLKARAADLRTRLAALAPAPGGGAADGRAVTAQLEALSSAIQALRAAGDGKSAAEAAALSAAARQQVIGGMPAGERDARQWELFTLIDAAAAKATGLVRGRLAELFAAMSALPQASNDALAARRDQKQRILDRIDLERHLRQAAGRTPAPAVTTTERARASAALAELRAQLTDTGTATLEPERASAAIKGLLNACTKCHRLNDDELALRPVTAAVSPMRAASFNHKPHVLQTACETCHGSVKTSRAGVDVNLAGLNTCQSCHDGSKARATCTTCHAYHPSTAVQLAVSRAR